VLDLPHAGGGRAAGGWRAAGRPFWIAAGPDLWPFHGLARRGAVCGHARRPIRGSAANEGTGGLVLAL